MASARENILTTPTREALKRVAGGRDGRYPFLERLTTGIVEWSDEFQSDKLHDGYQSTASGNASAAAALSTGVVNGELLLDPGDANSGRSDLSLGLHYRADLKCVCMARLKVNTNTSYKIEVGFTDVISGTDAGAVNSLSGNSFRASDCAVLIIDTSDTAFFQGAARDAATGVVTKIEDEISIHNQLQDDTFKTLIVELDAYDSSGNDTDDIGLARYTILDENEKLVWISEWQTAAISPTTLLTPWIFMQNRSGSARTCKVDYFRAFQRRTRTG